MISCLFVFFQLNYGRSNRCQALEERVNEIFPWEREKKSNKEKLNWAASGSGKPRLRKYNKAVQCFHRKSILCFSLMSSYGFVEDRSDFSTCREQWQVCVRGTWRCLMIWRGKKNVLGVNALITRNTLSWKTVGVLISSPFQRLLLTFKFPDSNWAHFPEIFRQSHYPQLSRSQHISHFLLTSGWPPIRY